MNTLGALVAGALSEGERAEVANHAAWCAHCHALIEGLLDGGAPQDIAHAPQDIAHASHDASPVGDHRLVGALERHRCARAGHHVTDARAKLAYRTPEFAGTDRFVIVRRVGAGGMGVVYEAWDRELDVRLALKTLRSLSPHRLSLFKNEFRALRGLSHRNLVTLGDLVEHRGQWFFTMELVDGAPFLSWLRPAHPGDRMRDRSCTGELAYPRSGDQRLRAELRQLADALHALHRHGKVHRDIKPSNVLVTPDGRVVVLDFGLVCDVREATHGKTYLMGTPAFMAPEQVSARGIGPAVDWYAAGVMLYAALTGQLPFGGTIDEVLAAKTTRLPIRPALLVDGVPEDLDALCLRLLAIDPADRAGGDDVLRALGGGANSEIAITPAFVGRARELAALDAALDQDGPVVIAIRGDAGSGKTTLLEHWLARAASSGAVVLAGRCCERESVPYKAIDGVIEALARWLSGQPEDVVRTLVPPHAAVLAEAFPALAAFAPASGGWYGPGEDRDLFEALRVVLERIAQRHRLVIAIDDLQCADSDSLAMLAALLRSPGAPPLVLVIATRSDARASSASLSPTRLLDLEPLAAADARRLPG